MGSTIVTVSKDRSGIQGVEYRDSSQFCSLALAPPGTQECLKHIAWAVLRSSISLPFGQQALVVDPSIRSLQTEQSRNDARRKALSMAVQSVSRSKKSVDLPAVKLYGRSFQVMISKLAKRDDPERSDFNILSFLNINIQESSGLVLLYHHRGNPS